MTLRFDDSVFTTKTKCDSSLYLFFIDVLVQVNRGLLPIRIHNEEQCSWICDPETEIPPSSLNKEPNSAFIHCHKPWISINDLISLFFSSRNLFHFVSCRGGIFFEKRRNKIFFWSLICERIFYNVFSCYIFINHSRWVETVKEIATLSIKIEPWYEIRSARHGRVQVKRIFKSKFLIRALAKLIASVQKSEWRVLQNFFFNYRIVYFNRILIWNVEYDLFWTFWIYILWFI